MNDSECGATFDIRIPDAPVDQWETSSCIQEHDQIPAPVGTIHDSGDGTRWVELNGFFERKTDSVREIIQGVIDYTEAADIGTQQNADRLTDELCAALGLPGRSES